MVKNWALKAFLSGINGLTSGIRFLKLNFFHNFAASYEKYRSLKCNQENISKLGQTPQASCLVVTYAGGKNKLAAFLSFSLKR